MIPQHVHSIFSLRRQFGYGPERARATHSFGLS